MDYTLLKDTLLGKPALETYIAAFIFVFLTILYKKSRKAKKERDTKSNRTPENWSWGFFIIDNARDFFSILIFSLLCFRFSNILISNLVAKWVSIPADMDLMLYAVVLGLLSTYLQEGLELLECNLGKWIVNKAKGKKSL